MGGGNRRYQMLKVSTMVRYMEETDRDLWIPLYPDHNLLAAGRHIIQKGSYLPMPSLMISGSSNNIFISEESYERMKAIEKRDIMMLADHNVFWRR